MNESDAKEQTAPDGEPDYLWLYAVVITFLMVTGLLAAEPVPAERIAAPAVEVGESLPPLTDCMMLPCHEAAEANHQFATAHWEWLCKMGEEEPWNALYWQARKDESNWNYEVWWRIYQATRPILSEEDRRKHLAILRQKVGRGAYNNGDWPPAVPLHRFEEIER